MVIGKVLEVIFWLHTLLKKQRLKSDLTEVVTAVLSKHDVKLFEH